MTFLGYTIGRCYAKPTGRPFIGTRPSQARVARLCRDISRLTGLEWTWLDEDRQITRLNHLLVGWANYFCLGPVQAAYRRVHQHAVKRLHQWLCRKHKVRGQRGTVRFSSLYLHESLRLVNLETWSGNRPWANA